VYKPRKEAEPGEIKRKTTGMHSVYELEAKKADFGSEHKLEELSVCKEGS
jgi:hypothetical protein